MRFISAVQYLDIDVERYLVETYLTKDEFSEKTMKYTILHYISSLDDLFLKEGFTGYNALHIDRVDPDRCVSPKLMIERRAERPEWHSGHGLVFGCADCSSERTTRGSSGCSGGGLPCAQRCGDQWRR